MLEKKLIKIYKLSSNFFYKKKQNQNQKSKHWERYNSKEITSYNLKNFRKYRGLSHGLDDQNKRFPFIVYSEVIKKVPEKFVLKNLSEKNIGNSKDLIFFKNKYLDFNKLIHIYWFWIIKNKIFKKNNIFSICEIGGGFGSFAELFLKNYKTKLLLIDLPEANLMSAYYLKKLFPKKKFYLFDNYKKKNYLTLSDFNKYDVLILPPNCNIDKKIKIDFFINARSMMEMNYDVIRSYFNFIHEYLNIGGFFLNINRYEKSSVGYPVKISEYPYDGKWKVVISESSFNQEWIHFLLTKRLLNNNQKGIAKELKRIKKIGIKFYNKYTEDNRDNRPIMLTKKIIKKLLKIFFSVKLLNCVGNLSVKYGVKLKNIK